MAGPRFQFVSGGVGARRHWAWPAEGTLPADRGPDGAWTAWRLLGSNNRELGRSARAFPDAETCAVVLSRSHAQLPVATATMFADPRSGLWRWQLAAEGRAVAASARAYLRQRECQHNLAAFLEAVTVAVPPQPRPSPRSDRPPGHPTPTEAFVAA